MLAILGIQGFIFALVGEYLGRLQRDVEGRPLYTVGDELERRREEASGPSPLGAAGQLAARAGVADLGERVAHGDEAQAEVAAERERAAVGRLAQRDERVASGREHLAFVRERPGHLHDEPLGEDAHRRARAQSLLEGLRPHAGARAHDIHDDRRRRIVGAADHCERIARARYRRRALRRGERVEVDR